MNVTKPARAFNIRGIAWRLRAESGFALPTTMLMLLAAFAVVSVGVASTVSVQSGTVRDQSTKSAVQLARDRGQRGAPAPATGSSRQPHQPCAAR